MSNNGDCNLTPYSNECWNKKNAGKCDFSCHQKGCQCGKCPHDYCDNPNHFKGCHCGYGKNKSKNFGGGDCYD